MTDEIFFLYNFFAMLSCTLVIPVLLYIYHDEMQRYLVLYR